MNILSTKNKRIKRSNEELRLEALKYVRKIDFQNISNSYYKQAWRKGLEFLNEICSHMETEWEPKWETIEEIQIEAHKYKNRTSFARGSSGAYDRAQRMGWLGTVCSFMGKKSNEAYSYEEIIAEALKHIKKSLFRKKAPGIWEAAYRRYDYNEICSHMKRSGDISCKEQELMDKLKETFFSAKTLKDRTVKISNKPYIRGFDIDIYVPEFNKGVEFDGEHWHSFEQLRKRLKKWSDEDICNYHQLKDDWFATKGIQILHIKEEDWDLDEQTCIQRCLEFLGGLDVKKVA